MGWRLETVTLRYFNVFGPYPASQYFGPYPASQYSGVLAKFTRQMLAGEPPTIWGDGEQSRDFTFIEKVVHANLLAAHAPTQAVSGRVFNIATNSQITLNQAASILRELTGYKGEVRNGPERPGDIPKTSGTLWLISGSLKGSGIRGSGGFS
jgi:UDP-glucose 4-epimerase